MIFLTLGTQLPFDRLVAALDEAVGDLQEPVFGQIGRTPYSPKNFETVDFLSPTEFAKRFEDARIIVSHAGIGTILSGMKAQKPLVLMARRAEKGEHRNDHQLATVSQIQKVAGVYTADTAEEIRTLLQNEQLEPMSNRVPQSRISLINGLRREILGDSLG
jgi:UDP-N-acetylglucosamine transferase subunit ALG13